MADNTLQKQPYPTPKPGLSSSALILQRLASNTQVNAQHLNAQKALNECETIKNELPHQPRILGSHVTNTSTEFQGYIPDSYGPTLQTGLFQAGVIFNRAIATIANMLGISYAGMGNSRALAHGNPSAYTDRGNFGGELNFGIQEQNKEDRQETQCLYQKLYGQHRAEVKASYALYKEQMQDGYDLQTNHQINPVPSPKAPTP